MTSGDIKSVQIIATTKDGKHIMTVSEEKPLIWHIVSCCKFVKLQEGLFEQCSLKEIMEGYRKELHLPSEVHGQYN